MVRERDARQDQRRVDGIHLALGKQPGFRHQRPRIPYDVGHLGQLDAVSINAFLTVKPSGSLLVRLESSFNHEIGAAQYLDAVDDASAVATFGTRYVFAAIDRRTASTTGRVELSLSPRMSLQTFTQVLFSKGRFGTPKALEAPGTFDFTAYRPPGFSDPDFDLKSLRANAVFRWEWRPGSTTYLVWTHTRDNSQIARLAAAEFFSLPSYNVFLVKTSWWFSR